MADSSFKRLVVQTSHYGLASLITMITGVITFPLLTRSFSVSDYGAMNLVSATLMVAVAAGKLGLQHSVLRYHSEITSGKSRFDLPQLYSTTLLGVGVSSFAVMTAIVLTVSTIPARWLGDPQLRTLFIITGLLIVVQVIESALVNLVRAEQKTALLMKYQVAKKYLSLGFILIAILAISCSLSAFYVATVIAELLALTGLASLMFRHGARPKPMPNQFSRPLLRELLAFGIPMMIGYELSGIILSVGDRYVIDGLIGQTQLGLYSAAYNFCQYIQAVLIASVGQAIMPLYMQMWDRNGREETSAFVSKSLRNYTLIGVPVVGGIAAVGAELLPSLASDRYAGASAVLPWVTALP